MGATPRCKGLVGVVGKEICIGEAPAETARGRLEDFFIRDELVARADDVLMQVRELVHWLRPSDGKGMQRDLEILDDGTLVAIDAEQLRSRKAGRMRTTLAVRLRMLSRLG